VQTGPNKLKKLHLFNNTIGDAGAVELAAALQVGSARGWPERRGLTQCVLNANPDQRPTFFHDFWTIPA
jgi:hypothetical protein